MEGGRYKVAWIDSFCSSRDRIIRSIFDMQPGRDVYSFATFEECLGPKVPRFRGSISS
jgi:hypothetical protein